jgi:hypothetical protein
LGLVDAVGYSGLAPGDRYRAELTLYERDRDGQCVATEVAASNEFTAAGPSGEVIVAGVTAPAPGVYVGYERIYRVEDEPDGLGDETDVAATDGTDVAGNDGAGAAGIDDTDPGGDTLLAVHEDCDDQRQTVWVLGMETAVAQSVVTGSGEMTDTVTVSGLANPGCSVVAGV